MSKIQEQPSEIAHTVADITENEMETAVSIQNDPLVQKSPIFYGWIIFAVGTIGLTMTSPGQTYAVSIFIEHFINDLSLSRSLVSTLYTVGTLTGSFALPFIGRQIDQRGHRLMVLLISVGFGLACIYMGFVQNAIMLGLGFVAIRMLGQGSLSVVSQNVINQWWVRRRGMIMGAAGLIFALLGLGLFPNVINWLIPIYGWRTTYMILGGILLLFMAPLGALFFRERPELYGLQPDGLTKPVKNSLVETAVPTITPSEEAWTVSEVIRTGAFWNISLGIASIAMLSTGLFFHMISIFDDNQLSASVAASVYVPIAVTTALVNLIGGYLMDRVAPRYLLATALLLQSICLVMVPYLSTVEVAFIYGMVLGGTSGLSRIVGSVIWASYFGRRHLGSITGLATPIGVAGTAFGPLIFGVGRDLMGTYNTVLFVSAAVPFLLGIAALFLTKPQK
ncbi:MAG: MFS transporter [Ardenticatenaceae bacterium]|nr:MAG: MFS transporter [Ardenticatenaceae bacterium]